MSIDVLKTFKKLKELNRLSKAVSSLEKNEKKLSSLVQEFRDKDPNHRLLSITESILNSVRHSISVSKEELSKLRNDIYEP